MKTQPNVVFRRTLKFYTCFNILLLSHLNHNFASSDVDADQLSLYPNCGKFAEKMVSSYGYHSKTQKTSFRSLGKKRTNKTKTKDNRKSKNT